MPRRLQTGGGKAHRTVIKPGHPDWYVPYEHMRETMKKILFATTALVASAGFASAEIKLSGMGEIGIVGGDAYGNETQLWTDVDVTFSMTGEADNGLAFGAKVDLDENGAFAGTTQGGETLFIAYGNFRLEMGDTDGALDAALTEIGIGSSIDDAHTTHTGFNGNSALDGTYDGQIARFQYTASSFTGHLSVEIDDSGVGDPVWGLGVAYNADLGGTALGIGLGYQTTDVNGSTAGGGIDVWGVSLSAKMANGIQAIVNYMEGDYGTANNMTYWGVGLGYSMNALTIGVNYGEYGDIAGVAGADTSGFGLAVDYDLGGGLQAQLGYGQSDLGVVEVDQWSLGLAMSF